MKLVKIWMGVFLALVLNETAWATRITGRVSEVAGNTVTVALDRSLKPAIGDAALVYVTLGGNEVVVGSGKVVAVAPPSTKVEIVNPTGTLAKDQLVRIQSAGEARSPKPTPTSATDSGN
ncbi:MAG: hypothetical protein QOG51_1549 [Verrucomicrobiota bacterium]